MDPMTGYLIASAAAPVIGGLLGQNAAQGDREAAMRLRRQAMDAFAGLQLPSVKEQEILLEQLRSQGQLTPEMEQAITQGRSEMEGISTDPRLKDAQLAALSSLQDIGNQGGMSATDRARWNSMQSDLNRNAGAQQAAVMQNFARRGQAGSGMELLAQLTNQQASADRASQQGMDIKAQAEQRALQALMSGGQLAGSMRDQDFSQASAKAQAQDAINRFNTQNRQDVQMRNVGASNAAQAANLGERQRIADVNVGMKNQQQIHNKGLLQQDFQNRMGRAAGMSGQAQSLAGATDARADRTAGMWAGIGSGLGQGIAAYGASQSARGSGKKPTGVQTDINDDRLKRFGQIG